MSVSPPKRLLMTTDAVGGVWRYAVSLAGVLARRRWEVLLAALGPPPDERQRKEIEAIDGVSLIVADLPLDWTGADRQAMEAAGAVLAGIARREACDLIHLNTPLLAAAASWPVPVIAVAHGCVSTWWTKARGVELEPGLAWHRQMTQEGLAACDRIIAPSLAFANDLATTYGIDRPIEVVYNGSLPPLFVGQEGGDPFVLTAGRLWDEVKSASTLDAVAARLEAPFLAAGSNRGPQGQHVETRHLRMLGQLSGIAMKARLAQRPIFVSAALFEPFGLAVLEAAQAGCPLVLSDIPTFRELWGGAAMFVEAHDAAGFVEAIEALLDDADLRRRLGSAARCRAADYSLAAMTDAMVAHYEDVLKECQPA